MLFKKYKYFLLIAAALTACQPWNDRIEVVNTSSIYTILEDMNGRNNLSRFVELVNKVGYDDVLTQSQNYTVFAPTNEALRNLDPAIVSDFAKLKDFVGNHIANSAYYAKDSKGTARIKMLNGKYVNFSNGQFDQAKVTLADQAATNGVLHVIDAPVVVLPNLWEYINATRAEFKQNDFVTKQTYLAFNAANAIVDSISALTGRPVYKPGTGFETRNVFTDQVYNLQDESKEFSYIVLTDAALAAEVAKLSPYYKTSTADSTYNLAAYRVVQDLALENTAPLSNIQAYTSKFGVRVPIVASSIIKTVKLSNGTLYVMDKVDFKKEDKIKSVIIEGENIWSRLQATSSTTTFIRDRYNPTTKLNYRDIGVVGHGITGYWLGYQARAMPSMKYKVYWVSINDNTPTATVNQRLAMGTTANTTFPFVAVPLNEYKEVLLGEYTMASWGTLNMYLMASGTNALILDYIRLEPVF